METLTVIQNERPESGGCACCAAPAADRQTPKETAVSEITASLNTVAVYRVSGMTCGHCVQAVSGEVGAIEGVTAVDVDLENGSVTVTSTAPLDLAAVRAAVDEAGYEVVA